MMRRFCTWIWAEERIEIIGGACIGTVFVIVGAAAFFNACSRAPEPDTREMYGLPPLDIHDCVHVVGRWEYRNGVWRTAEEIREEPEGVSNHED